MSRIGLLQNVLSSLFARPVTPSIGEDTRSITELCDALLSERGEVSGMRIAATILQRFSAENAAGQLAFFKLLQERFDITADNALRAAQHYSETPDAANLAILRNSVEPRRMELLRRLNHVPGATGDLVQMRACLLDHIQDDPELSRIDVDFQRLFAAWFNRGFLILQEINWQTPANVLEKIIAYEAVHAINSWQALRSRLLPSDRKCFAFFHPAMPDEPLIFVEVALTQTNPQDIRSILSEERTLLSADDASTAVFYSISNCQRGLAGVSFGNFLIKQVATELSTLLPNLNTFRTLSPVPGLMPWVNTHSDKLSKELKDAVSLAKVQSNVESVDTLGANEASQLSKLAAHYLVNAKSDDTQPLDSVARFHLGNGASLDQILPDADKYERGRKQSAGVMVSYLYNLDKVEANHEAYARYRQVIASNGILESLGGTKVVR
ncbi:MAG: malonyl-CoA decarboxylase family protein [Granulosicoccaceae bacterium]